MIKKIWPAKDPQENPSLPYGFNWTPRNIGTQQIVSIDTTVISGSVTVDASTVAEIPNARTGQGTAHVFSGGVDGEMCELLLTATTEDGSVMQQTVYLPIRQK